MKKQNIWLILISLVIIIAVIIGIQRIQKPIPNEQIIKIGAILPLTGEVEIFGKWLKEGIEIAAEESNIKIVYEDNKNQTAQAITSFTKLVEIDRVNGIITARTPVAYALTPLAAKYEIPTVFTFADLPENTNGYVINFHYPVADEIDALTKVISNYLGPKASIITVNDEFGFLSSKLFKEKFKGEVLYEAHFDPHQIDFKSILTKIPSNSDFIFLVGYGQNLVGLVKGLQERKILLPIVSINSFMNFYDLVKNYLKTPVYVPMPLFNIDKYDHSLYEDFSYEFRNKFNRSPNFVNLEAYEATKFLIELLKKAKNKQEVKEIMTSPSTIESISGELKLDKSGQVHFPLSIVKIYNDRKEVITIIKW